MQQRAQESISVWKENEKPAPAFSPLGEHVSADVCIVGAGIAGLTTGYLLAKEGKSVVIVDAWGLAAGETGRTTAHLTAVLDDRFFTLASLFGDDGVKLAAESHMSAINRIEAIIREEGIACDFERVDGYLVALSDEQRKDFEKEQIAAKEAGFADMTVHTHLPLSGIKMSAPTLHFPQQATFHILNYKAANRLTSKPTMGLRSPQSTSLSPPTRPSTIGSRCTPSRRPIAPM